MRHSVRAVLVSLCAAAVCAAAPVATAAPGELIVGGKVYTNPSGCVLLGANDIRSIHNNTKSVVTIYTDATCTGIATAILHPGDNGTYTGKSALVK